MTTDTTEPKASVPELMLVTTLPDKEKNPGDAEFTEIRTFRGSAKQVLDYFQSVDLPGLKNMVEGWGDQATIVNPAQEIMTFIWKLRASEASVRYLPNKKQDENVYIEVPVVGEPSAFYSKFDPPEREIYAKPILELLMPEHEGNVYQLNKIVTVPSYFEHSKNFYRFFYLCKSYFSIGNAYNLSDINRIGMLSLVQPGQTVQIEMRVTNRNITVALSDVHDLCSYGVLFLSYVFDLVADPVSDPVPAS